MSLEKERGYKMKIYQVLTKARNLLKKGWTKGVFARNKYGHEVSINSRSACKFCAQGAVAKVTTHEHNHSSYILARNFLNKFTDGMLMSFNDNSNKERVLELFDKAITKAKLENI